VVIACTILLFTINGDDENSRLIGCTNLPRGKRFAVALGNRRNRLEFKRADVGESQGPVDLNTTHGLSINAKDW